MRDDAVCVGNQEYAEWISIAMGIPTFLLATSTESMQVTLKTI